MTASPVVAMEQHRLDVDFSRQALGIAGHRHPHVGARADFEVRSSRDGQPRAAESTTRCAEVQEVADDGLADEEAQLRALRKQVEWYFSDANLSTDSFFYGKISEAMPEGWLSARWLLRCRKLKELGASVESIYEALQESHLEARFMCMVGRPLRELFVRRRQPLPPFVGREHRTLDGKVTDRPEEKVLRHASMQHGDPFQNMGCLTDQRRVQDTLGLKEIGDDSIILREVLTTHGGERSLGPVLSRGYERVIYGDGGPKVEFNASQINWEAWLHFHDKSQYGEKRFYDEYFTAHSWPLWQQRWRQGKKWQSGRGVLMLYAQRRSVDCQPFAPDTWWAAGCADYRAGLFYVAADPSLLAVEGRRSDAPQREGLSADKAVLAVVSGDIPQREGLPVDEAALAVVSGSYEPNGFHQSRVCWDWQRGHCWKGTECKWSHASPQCPYA